MFKNFFYFLFLGVLFFVSCDTGMVGSDDLIDPDDSPTITANIVVKNESEETDTWYNVDNNSVTWNKDYFSSQGVSITLVSEDESYSMILDENNTSGSFVNNHWIYANINYIDIVSDSVDEERINVGDYFLIISDGSTTAKSARINILDAKDGLVRAEGDVVFYPSIDDKIELINYSPWSVDLTEWTLIGGSVTYNLNLLITPCVLESSYLNMLVTPAIVDEHPVDTTLTRNTAYFMGSNSVILYNNDNLEIDSLTF
jgi:hypothetical protein